MPSGQSELRYFGEGTWPRNIAIQELLIQVLLSFSDDTLALSLGCTSLSPPRRFPSYLLLTLLLYFLFIFYRILFYRIFFSKSSQASWPFLSWCHRTTITLLTISSIHSGVFKRGGGVEGGHTRRLHPLGLDHCTP